MIRTNMGPRGRRFRNREFRPGIMIGLLSLFFGGWIVIAVLGGLLGAGVMTVGALLSAVRHFFIHVVGGAFTHGYSLGGILLGVLIGLAIYNNRKKEARREEEESFRADDEKEEDDDSIVAAHYMFHH